MTVRLSRTSHGGTPALSILEIDDDDAATLAQTSGHRVGRFARALTTGERKALDRALAGASAADPPAAASGPRRPSGTVEQLVAEGLPDLVLDAGATPPSGFKDLVRVLRRLRDGLADSPVAAVELEVTGSPRSARLQHLGSEPMTLRVSPAGSPALTVTTTLFGPDSAILETGSETVDASDANGDVGPGWTLPLVSDLETRNHGKGGFLTVTVGPLEADALGDGVLRPAELSWLSE